MSKAGKVATATEQAVKEMQERYERLNTKKIEAGRDLKNAQENLAKLKQEALEKYQTDDLATLRQKLETMKLENEKKRQEYLTELNKIETELSAIEKQYQIENPK
jgi:hypothetical protein